MITPEERQHGTEENLPPPLYGLVLAGGKSGTAGAFAKHFEILDEHCELAFLSSRADQAELPEYKGFPQILDVFTGMGPMSGILSALRACPGAAWLVVAATLPRFDIEMVAHLVVNRNTERAVTAYLSPADGMPDPLCAIYEPRSRELLLSCVREGITCPKRALIGLGGTRVESLTPPRGVR
ncbi:MAG: molybdopterin-guanine dinucleotide biosynthesis protein MobA [Verrucomicrobia bacterium ADurb.Bin345]|nr:MAG: molybdopterin-guanine dinucleotide biosynthesis protein MobA [Verrucomicrobia bacterium ADurb.Bin345]